MTYNLTQASKLMTLNLSQTSKHTSHKLTLTSNTKIQKPSKPYGLQLKSGVKADDSQLDSLFKVK